MIRNKSKYIFVCCLLLLAAVPCLWYACTRCSVRNNYLAAVPADAQALSRIQIDDVAQLSQNLPFLFSDLILHKLADKTGVDYSEPVYAFVNSEKSYGLIAAISNQTKLEDLLTENHITVEEKYGMKWAVLPFLQLVFDEHKLLAVSNPPNRDNISEDYMTSLMTQSEPVRSELLQSLDTLSGPVCLAARASALPETVTEPLNIMLPKDSHLEDISINAVLSFENDCILMEGNLASDHAEINKLLDLMDETFHPIGEMVSFDAENSSLRSSLQFNTEGERLLQFARSIPKVRLALLALNMCIDADMMIKAIDGLVSVISSHNGDATPNTTLTASLRNSDFLANIDAWDDNLTSGSIGFEKLSVSTFRIHALESDFWFDAGNSLCISSPSPIEEVPQQDNLEAPATSSRLVMHMNLKNTYSTIWPALMKYVGEYNVLEAGFTDSRHFSMQLK